MIIMLQLVVLLPCRTTSAFMATTFTRFFVVAAAIIMAMIIAAICFAFFFVFDFAIVYEFRVHCNSVVKPSSLWIQFSFREKKVMQGMPA